MNIYATKGDKVRCNTLSGGYDYHEEIAKRFLEIGKEYTIEVTVVDSWHTDVHLQEFPNIKFNSVFFEDVVEESVLNKRKLDQINKEISNADQLLMEAQQKVLDLNNKRLTFLENNYLLFEKNVTYLQNMEFRKLLPEWAKDLEDGTYADYGVTIWIWCVNQSQVEILEQIIENIINQK
jgi:hypothetical protein